MKNWLVRENSRDGQFRGFFKISKIIYVKLNINIFIKGGDITGKNNVKFTQEYVENYFKEKGCILLDTYVNSHTQMKYICKCGNEASISFTKFKTQKHGCKKCTKIGGYTQDEVTEYFKSNGCELLDRYTGVRNKMKYKCVCGEISYISFDNFKRGKRCGKCGLNKLSEQFRTNIDEVKQYFYDNDCIPLFDNYINDREKLKYQCSCGNISYIVFADFKSGRRCNKCSSERRNNTFYLNGSQRCSIQQTYLHNLLGGELNYPVKQSCLDIAFPEEKVYIEYDGSGHDLSVKLGELIQEQFNEKEKRRTYALYRQNWKCIRIVSRKDRLPSNDNIISIINYAKEVLKNHSWIVFDIDNQEVLYSNCKERYIFENLKRIRNDYVS